MEPGEEIRPSFEISFSPASGDVSWTAAWVPGEVPYEPAPVEDLTQAAFLWDNFTVDVVFRIGTIDIGEHAQGAAVLDFVLMLQAARRAATATGDVAELQLSDRQGLWCFAVREAGMVEIRFQQATTGGWRSAGSGRCSLAEFEAGVDRALTAALQMIFTRQPIARRNRYLQGLTANGFAAA
jgi:hypothetical protein